MIGDVSETLQSLRQGIAERLTAQIAYGEPVARDGVTVIPVARVVLGFGAGAGVGQHEQTDGGDVPSGGVGGGGGGGGGVQPLGFIEISATGARWVALEPPVAEVVLRALSIAAILLPFGGRRGLLTRMLMLLIGRALSGRLFRPNLPAIPEGLRFGKGFAQG